jgi:nitrogen fixation NifU-like protein
MSETDQAQSESSLSELYRETILRHSANPVAYQSEIRTTHENEQYNPLCGDRISLMFELSGNRIEAVAFDGAACAICMASASLLCESAAGQTVEDIRDTHDWLQQALETGETQDGNDQLGALLAVRRYPSRIQCALLPWVAAVKALFD